MTDPSHTGRYLRLFAVVAFAFAAAVCGEEGEVGHGGHLVGGPCGSNHDCDDRCLEGKPFPGGTCTIPCDGDGDCPDGTLCIEREGGVCLLHCDGGIDCRDHYACKDQDRRGHGGKASVCID